MHALIRPPTIKSSALYSALPRTWRVSSFLQCTHPMSDCSSFAYLASFSYTPSAFDSVVNSASIVILHPLRARRRYSVYLFSSASVHARNFSVLLSRNRFFLQPQRTSASLAFSCYTQTVCFILTLTPSRAKPLLYLWPPSSVHTTQSRSIYRCLLHFSASRSPCTLRFDSKSLRVLTSLTQPFFFGPSRLSPRCHYASVSFLKFSYAPLFFFRCTLNAFWRASCAAFLFLLVYLVSLGFCWSKCIFHSIWSKNFSFKTHPPDKIPI